jgi:hypothetical protein
MIGIASDFHWIAFQISTDATKVTIELCPDRLVNK